MLLEWWALIQLGSEADIWCHEKKLFVYLVSFVLFCDKFSKGSTLYLHVLLGGGVRVCSDAALLNFWCGFAEIFILSCSIVVLQNEAVGGI